MAYDKATKQVILFGVRQTTRNSETWAWTASSGWKQLAVATNPPGRTWGNMAYDDATGQIVLFGGQSATPASNGALNPLRDTWTWDGKDWTHQKPAQNPPAIVNMSLAYDASTKTVIGVLDNDTSGVSETWQWNGTTWGRLLASRLLTYPKQDAGIAYATVTSDMTLFGTVFGLGAPPADGKTWAYTPNAWKAYAASANTPKPRSSPGMSEDTRGGVLMFGGGGSGFTVFSDTWTWYGHEWRKLSVKGASGRVGPKMAYDSTCGLVLLYGGELSTGQQVTFYKDTWAWNGQTWIKVG
jgi:hypothetical protein